MKTIDPPSPTLTWTANDPDHAITGLIDASGQTVGTIGITLGALPDYVGVLIGADGSKREVLRRARIGHAEINAANYADARQALEIMHRSAWIDTQLEVTEAHIAASRAALAEANITAFLTSAVAGIRRHQKFVVSIWGS